MVIPKINSAHGSDTRNIINRAIDSIYVQGKSIQDLVAKGQLTPEQYATLIQTVNGLISKGEIVPDDLSPALLEAINKSDGVPFNILSIPKNETVSPIKTTFFKRSTNLFNHIEITNNKTIDRTTGKAIDFSQNVSLTNFMPFNQGEKFITRNTSLIAFYDESKIFIKAIDTLANTVYESPSKTQFIRATAPTHTVGKTAQINIGSSLNDFELFYEYIPKENLEEQPFNLPLNSVEKEHIKNQQVTPEKTNFFRQSTNLLNHLTATENKLIDRATGKPVDSSQPHAVINFTEVTPNTDYSVYNMLTIAYYDADKNFLSIEDMTTNIFTTPSDAHFIRGTTFIVRLGNNAQINLGRTLLDFEPYYAYVKKEHIEIEDNQNFMADTNLNRLFDNNKIIDDDYLGRRSATVAEIYALYDALMEAHPNYITRTLLGNDSSGLYPIYRYDFKPIRPRVDNEIKHPKLMITSGMHPEKAAVWSLYHTMENICNNWQDDEAIAALRFNFHFIVIPMGNPWGYETPSRTNSNGVDLIRNYELGWWHGEYIPPPSSTSIYGGPSPLSEVETQYINKILLDNTDMIAAIDFHNFFGAEGSYDFIWGVGENEFVNSVMLNHIQKMDRKWKKEYSFMSQDPDKFIGYLTDAQPIGGSMGMQANALGVKGSLIYEVNVRVGADANGEVLDSNTITMGYEAFTNLLLSLTYHLLDRYYNNPK